MSWGLVDDKFWTNQKIKRLREHGASGRAAIGSYMLAVSYCNDILSDGILTPFDVRALAIPKSDRDKLVAVGLWDDKGDGYYGIHDFLDFNKSREQVMRERQSHAGRQAAYLQRKALRDGDSDASHDASHDAGRDAPPIHSHTKGVSQSPPYSPPRDVVLTYRDLVGRVPSQGALAYLNRLTRTFGEESVCAALETEWAASHDLSTLIGRSEAALVSESRRKSEDERKDELRRVHESQVEATQERIRRLQSAEADPGVAAAALARMREVVKR